jgi:hypothetical protein
MRCRFTEIPDHAGGLLNLREIRMNRAPSFIPLLEPKLYMSARSFLSIERE